MTGKKGANRGFIAQASKKSTLDPAVPSQLKAELIAESRSPHDVPELGISTAKLVPSEEIAKIFAGKGWWGEFYRRFPKSRGFIEFTMPVFTPDGQHALVYVSQSCGGLCGTGWLVYLTRKAGNWHVDSQRMLWIS